MIALVVCALFAQGCSDPIVPGGEITIRNDIQDEEFNEVTVSHIVAKSGGGAYRVTLKPDQSVVLPHKGISSLTFSRRYKDHTNVYVVGCPSGFDKQITMKLIDVHLNKLRGGCLLRQKGVEKNGFVDWEK